MGLFTSESITAFAIGFALTAAAMFVHILPGLAGA